MFILQTINKRQSIPSSGYVFELELPKLEVQLNLQHYGPSCMRFSPAPPASLTIKRQTNYLKNRHANTSSIHNHFFFWPYVFFFDAAGAEAFPFFFFFAATSGLLALGSGKGSLLLAMKLDSGRGPGATWDCCVRAA